MYGPDTCDCVHVDDDLFGKYLEPSTRAADSLDSHHSGILWLKPGDILTLIRVIEVHSH